MADGFSAQKAVVQSVSPLTVRPLGTSTDIPAFLLDPSKEQVWSDSGSITITPSAANTPTSGAITFSRTFPVAPNVVVSPNTTVPGTGVTGVGVSGIGTAGATGWVTRTNTSATALQWIANLRLSPRLSVGDIVAYVPYDRRFVLVLGKPV